MGQAQDFLQALDHLGHHPRIDFNLHVRGLRYRLGQDFDGNFPAFTQPIALGQANLLTFGTTVTSRRMASLILLPKAVTWKP